LGRENQSDFCVLVSLFRIMINNRGDEDVMTFLRKRCPWGTIMANLVSSKRPIESKVGTALDKAKITYVDELDERSKGLDFYLVDLDVHIECKQFHTERISEQMSRSSNIIAIQGLKAAELFSDLLASSVQRDLSD
jgi:hypothetical protein